ncbi:type II toxin-antitoxin system RelE/ParE family toxin [Erysipelotrichaceae bacterium 51-3]
MFSIIFFRNDDGRKPVGDFIRTLDAKTKAKVVSDLHRLEMLGNEARAPLSKYLGNGTFELRSILEKNTIRILYFFDGDEIIIATNGFINKQRKTPVREIELAKRRRKIYLKRKG